MLCCYHSMMYIYIYKMRQRSLDNWRVFNIFYSSKQHTNCKKQMHLCDTLVTGAPQQYFDIPVILSYKHSTHRMIVAYVKSITD